MVSVTASNNVGGYEKLGGIRFTTFVTFGTFAIWYSLRLSVCCVEGRSYQLMLIHKMEERQRRFMGIFLEVRL